MIDEMITWMRANGSIFDKKIGGCKIGFKFLDEPDFFFFLHVGDSISDKISANVHFR